MSRRSFRRESSTAGRPSRRGGAVREGRAFEIDGLVRVKFFQRGIQMRLGLSHVVELPMHGECGIVRYLDRAFD